MIIVANKNHSFSTSKECLYWEGGEIISQIIKKFVAVMWTRQGKTCSILSLLKIHKLKHGIYKSISIRKMR